VNIRNAYTYWSATYDEDRNLTRDLDAIVTRETLRNWRFRSILEIGCGTGKNTVFLAEIGQNVHALDFSEAMINRAKTKVPSDNVSFALADITKPWPDDAQSANLIVCNLVLEHIGDLPFIFSEVSRVLAAGGHFFVCELHPFRQYLGAKANFQQDRQTTEIPAFVHHLTDFTNAAEDHGLTLTSLKEWWHEEDRDKPPRLVSFLFEKRA
jgi:ubiquinone/menaquinone biosynthesis C-methylase UbiE